MTQKAKIVVLDDDPTGSQTVHDCLLLTRWDVATLKEALADSAPLFFILTNTRAVDAARAAAITRAACRNLKKALTGLGIQPIFVSRSDSTLRGHYPVETDAIAEELGPFDAHFLVPAFFEGGRITRASVHYLKNDGREIPVHETEFARDSVFGYRHSYLPDYVEEKTQGRIKAASVVRLQLEDIRRGVYDRLLSLRDNACVVVDAERQDDLDRFAADVLRAAGQGKRFLFRSAASLLTSLAQLPPQPVPPERIARYVRADAAGAVIVGSHVPRTTRQLEALLQQPGIAPIEVDVNRLPKAHTTLLKQVLVEAELAHRLRRTPVVYTSRAERVFPDQAARLAFGGQVSALLRDVVRGLPTTLGFLVSKGGITSNDVLSVGLQLRTARLLGQILPGVSVVRCPHDHPRYPDLPVVIFPGNVGDDHALATVFARLRDATGTASA
ncbi:MAG: four-carbon acid sugar kinase family protein [Sulfuricaulis sp.]